MNEFDIDPEVSDYFPDDPKMEEQDEKRLLKQLEDRMFLDTIKHSEEWRIIREAWRRLYLDADQVLSTCKPTDVATIAFSQAIKMFYKDVLTNTIKRIKQDGDAALNALKVKGKLNKVRTRKKR